MGYYSWTDEGYNYAADAVAMVRLLHLEPSTRPMVGLRAKMLTCHISFLQASSVIGLSAMLIRSPRRQPSKQPQYRALQGTQMVGIWQSLTFSLQLIPCNLSSYLYYIGNQEALNESSQRHQESQVSLRQARHRDRCAACRSPLRHSTTMSARSR